MATENPIDEEEEREQQEHSGGGRFNRRLGVTFISVAMLGGVVLALGVRSSGTSQNTAAQKAADDPGAAAWDRGEIEDLAAHGIDRYPAASFVPLLQSSRAFRNRSSERRRSVRIDMRNGPRTNS
jgi:hypothetical protein